MIKITLHGQAEMNQAEMNQAEMNQVVMLHGVIKQILEIGQMD